MNSLVEVNNVFPQMIQKTFISPEENVHLPILRHEAFTICRKKMSDMYIQFVLRTFENGILYSINGVPQAFCVWKIHDRLSIQTNIYKRELYILLLCAKESEYKYTRMMIYDMERYCIDNGIQHISLEPANDALRRFYTKHGFINNNGRMNNDLMVKRINIPVIPRTRKTRRARRSE